MFLCKCQPTFPKMAWGMWWYLLKVSSCFSKLVQPPERPSVASHSWYSSYLCTLLSTQGLKHLYDKQQKWWHIAFTIWLEKTVIFILGIYSLCLSLCLSVLALVKNSFYEETYMERNRSLWPISGQEMWFDFPATLEVSKFYIPGWILK